MTSRRVISREQRQCSQIRPFLYVGGLASLSPRVLSRIATTINLIPGFRLSAPAHQRVVHIPLQDDESTEIAPYMTTIFKEIDDVRKKAGRVLLLCAMGISRSATFAIAYLMCVEKMTLHDAYKHVQMCRNIVCPNVGFFQQLIDLEEKMRGKTTVTIIEPIPGIKVADVVWDELYSDMMSSMSESDRHSLRSLNIGVDSARKSCNDTRSLRSLNIIDETKVDDTSRSLESFVLSDNFLSPSTALNRPLNALSTSQSFCSAPTSDTPDSAIKNGAVTTPTTVLPKSALRDKSRANEKKKRWRLSFSKDVTG